jgi:D-lactate dehydrogenase (cytochrome)
LWIQSAFQPANPTASCICTGEHGIGIGKRKFMQLENGDSYQLMRRIKDLIDPKGLLNPGKIFMEP